MNELSPPERLPEPVTILTLRTVKAGHQNEFEHALHEFISRSFETEGQLGVNVIQPVKGSRMLEYGFLRRFRDKASCDRFYSSSLYKQWELTIATWIEGETKRQNLSGLETWFVNPGWHAVIPPPRWKMALVTLAGVFPTSTFISLALGPFIDGVPFILHTLIVASGMVTLLTWVVMPLLVRILKSWL